MGDTGFLCVTIDCSSLSVRGGVSAMRNRILIGAGIAALAVCLLWWVLSDRTARDAQRGASGNELGRSPQQTPPANAAGARSQTHSNHPNERSAEWQTQLAGVVVTPNGVPAASAEVVAWIANDAVHACRVDAGAPSLRVLTTVDGEFSIQLSEEEVYCVQARHPDWTNSSVRRVQFEATNVSELRLVLQAALHVAGRVVDAGHAPVAGVALQLTGRDSPAPTEHRAVADANGSFVFPRVGLGGYELSSVDERYAVSHPQQIAMNANQPLDNLIVTLYQLVWIRGRVLDASGKPIADAQVTARSPYSEELYLGRAQTNANGEFRLASQHRSPKATIAQRMLEPGAVNAQGNERRMPLQSPTRVCLEASHLQWGNAFASVTPGEQSFDAAPFYLTRRNAAVRGVLVDRRGDIMSAQLQFRQVVDALPGAPGDCELLPAVRSAIADAQGRFTVQLPTYGRYEVEVIGAGQPQTVIVEVGGNRELRIALE